MQEGDGILVCCVDNAVMCKRELNVSMRDGREDTERYGGANRLHHTLPLNPTANTTSAFHLRFGICCKDGKY